MVGIYKITNLVNGKSYIGQSVNIERRFINHKSVAFNPNDRNYNYPLYRAIRKYGIENFSFEILEECLKNELNEKEVFYIDKYRTHGINGYNQDDGGYEAHYGKLSDELVGKIIDRLKTSLDTSDEIGEDFGLTGRTIRGINTGEYCFRDNEVYPIRPPLFSITESEKEGQLYEYKPDAYYCTICGKEIATNSRYCVLCSQIIQRRVGRPEAIELAKMIKENGFSAVGRKFGVTDNTIKKWCEIYGMPRLKGELISWYNNKLGIVGQPKVEKVKIIQEKQVKQIDLNTNQVLNIFPSENSAARFLGKKKGNHIGEVCRGIHEQAYGFRWEYV